MEKDEVLKSVIIELLAQFKEVGKQVVKNNKGKLSNDWVIPYLLAQLDSFNPESLKGKSINLAKGEEISLENIARGTIKKLKANTAYNVAIKLAGGLPENEIYSATNKGDQLKKMLYERGGKEAASLIKSYDGEAGAVVKKYFANSRAFETAEEHKAYAEAFSSLFLKVADDLVIVADWLGGKTKIRIVGGKIKSVLNPMVMESLKITQEPDWDNLPLDIKKAGKIISNAYLNFEEELRKKRY